MKKSLQAGQDDGEHLPAVAFLREKGIPFSLFTHARPPRSLEEAALERGQAPEQVVRSILFRVSEGIFVMVLAAGPGQIAWGKLRHYLGSARITMATHDEVLERTGSLPGAVSPLGLPEPMRILADNRLLDHETVSLGSGMRGTAILIQPDDLILAIPSIEFGDFLVDPNRQGVSDEA